ncbi:PanM family protein [Pseudomonas putida]|uniref:acetyl-CoA sensor PanZ family protein n=1 Tax=Pseudomonas putida TaxID=303 RepID=UPI00236488E1|nr:acetyl-CoA sensor PanZ family protein [Pseudomonas putida]MDD2052732.1 PanM family protein [Pseudomonas putida]
MPVVFEPLTLATEQDRQDLHKIYLDAPDGLLADQGGASTFIANALANGQLVAGRFNGRLLGAARLDRQAGVWQLSHLCVRKLTRRRGVAERLLCEAHRLARQAGAELRLLAPAGHLEARALAAKLDLPLNHD